MTLPRNCTATKGQNTAAAKAFVFAASLMSVALAWAGEVAGTVVNLSGPLMARKADGSVKALSLKSTVENGDTLVSEKDTYARIRFTDNSEITLKPNTQFKIENFSFDEGKPEKDAAVFNLVKGGLRAVTGTLGKRSNERFGLNTPTATIGIRGTIFIAEYIPPDSAAVAAYGMASLAALTPVSMPDIRGAGMTMTDVPLNAVPVQAMEPLQVAQFNSPVSSPAAGRAPGLYVQVLDGMIHVSNPGGAQNFSAGQFGYTPNITTPPVIVPKNPGMQFTPPPKFSTDSQMPSTSSATPAKNSEVDCEVR
jgi:hypothetical protein